MRRRWIVAMVCIVGSCGVPNTFLCESDTECDEGQCEVNGFCSFEDGSCESGRRYGDHAGLLSGNCVAGEMSGTTEDAPPPDDSTSDGGGDSSSTGPDSGTTLSLADSDSSTGSDDASSGPSSVDSTSGTTTSGTEESSGSSTGETPPMTHPYQGCDDADECLVAGSACTVVAMTPPQCLPLCMSDVDCPAPPDPTNEVDCVMGFCLLVCDGMSGCPGDMQCDVLGFCAPLDS